MIIEMGNKLCALGQAGSKPPRDLASFLKEAADTEANNQHKVSWLNEFRNFLTNNKQVDVLNCLQFVLELEEIKVLSTEETRNPSRKRLDEIRSTKLHKLREIGNKFFSVQSEQCIPLSNQVLLEEAGSTLRGLGPDGLEEGLQLVEAASRDNRVWKSGLDAAYRNFVSTNPNQTISAVLLSIL